MVFNFLNAQEKTRLEKIQKLEDRAYTESLAVLKRQQDFTDMALKNNQGGLAAQFMALQPNSPTYQKDFSTLVAKINDPMMKLDMALKNAQLSKIQKETRLLGEPSATERKAEATALESKEGQNLVLQDKLDLINTIKTSKGLSNRVGSTPFSRKGRLGLPDFKFADFTGSGQAFAGAVHRLTSQEFLDKLIQAKSQGATFGALTDREGDALRAAATQLNDWEMKNDKGLGTGVWNIDERRFLGEINRIETLAKKAKGGTISIDEESDLNSIFSPDNTALDPSGYY